MHILETNALFGYACAELRPQWNGNQVTGLQEAAILAASHFSIALLAVSLIALWQRKLWLTLALCMGWRTWAFHVIFEDIMNRTNFTAQKIGCIGSSTTFLTVANALCTVILAITLIHRRKTIATGPTS